MPKKKGNQDQEKEKKKSSGKIVSFLIVLLFLLLWIITFAFLIKLDIGNLGTSLRPMLKDVPVLKYLLPAVPDDQVAFEENYPYYSLGEAINRIIELEGEIDGYQKSEENYRKQILALQQQIADLQAENARLKVFEDEQEAFAERVREFDRLVVFADNAPSIEEYRKFYEEINPTTAEELYRQVLEILAYDDAIQEEAKRLVQMKPSNAAAILEEMSASIELVANYLLCMKTSEAAAIMQKMDTLYAAHIMQKIADMNEEKMEEIRNAIGTGN